MLQRHKITEFLYFNILNAVMMEQRCTERNNSALLCLKEVLQFKNLGSVIIL